MKNAEHLLRLGGVAILAVIGFFAMRAFLVPPSFGQFGHYRGNAVEEIGALPIVHAGHQVCEGCHTDIFDQKKTGKHAGVACEACHGPQAKHAQDPLSLVPAKPDSAVLCAQCHAADPAKPKWFAQVNAPEHSAGLPCVTCHQAHTPSLGDKK